MEILDPGHSYVLNSVGNKHNQRVDFVKKSNDVKDHGVPDVDGVLTQELLRVVIDRLSYLDNVMMDNDTHFSLIQAKECFYNLERRAWLRKKQGVNGKPEAHVDGRVPFNRDDVLTLPVGKDGHVIPTIPDIETGVEYTHDHGVTPSGPVAFMDPETRIIAYTKDEGWVEGIKCNELDWTKVHHYKKFEPIDESILDFGLF